MLKLIIASMMMWAFTACSVTTPHTKYESKAPGWYYNPPQEDVSAIYAVGEGATHKEAITDALSNINNELGVKVSVNYKNEVRYRSETAYFKEQKTKKTIESSTYPLEFRNYKIQDSFERKDNIAVLVKLEKLEYGDFIQNKVKEDIVQLKNQEKTAMNSNYITKVAVYEELNTKSYEVQTYIDVYHQISGNTARLAREARYIRQLRSNYESILNNKKVNVKYLGEASDYKEDFEVYLSENRYNIRVSDEPLKITLGTKSSYNEKTKMTTYYHKIVIKEYDDIIKTKEFTVIEYGKKANNKSLAKKHFRDEIQDIVLK